MKHQPKKQNPQGSNFAAYTNNTGKTSTKGKKINEMNASSPDGRWI
jgi:hypothetical protein|tara:strand:- start:1947 stop:2084 length:138 start_codon:yes stop_codon:yes gene_type:complete